MTIAASTAKNSNIKINNAKNSKKLSALLCIVAGSLLSLNAFADVTLNVDDNIKVTAINGKAVNTNLFAPIKKTFTLQPGTHAITAKYDRLFELRGDDHDYLRSGNVSVATDLQDNQTYTLIMPNQPEDYDAAKEYAKHPTLAIKLGNNVIAEETATVSDGGGILSGITSTVGSIFSGGEDAESSNREVIASLGYKTAPPGNTASNRPIRGGNGSYAAIEPAAATPVAVAPVAATTPSGNATKSTLDTFMQLWLKATPEERAKIRQWVAE